LGGTVIVDVGNGAKVVSGAGAPGAGAPGVWASRLRRDLFLES
jgi:hypothetical protein